MERSNNKATIDIYGVDHRSEQHAQEVAAAIRDTEPDYVLREALDRASYQDVKEDVMLDGQIATPHRLTGYTATVANEELDTSYLDDEEYDLLLVDLSPEKLLQIHDQLAGMDGTDAAVERINEYVERIDCPNSTETYRVNAAVYDVQQNGSDTKVAGMDAQTGASSTSPTMMAQRNRAMADKHTEVAQDSDMHILSITGANHAQEVAQLLELEGYNPTVTYPEAEDSLPSTSDYNAWIASKL